MNETNSIDKTRTLLDRWIAAKTRLKRANQELSSAECELSNSENEVGKWLVPSDSKIGETFNIWFGSGIVAVTNLNGSNFSVQWRREPDGKDLKYGV